MSKIKVSVVSYLNSKVFLKGLVPEANNDFEISLDIPSQCAFKLSNNIVDIGLIPVAVLPEIKSGSIISNYCISADGAVNSVFLFSNSPVQQINKIYLDMHSRTSNALCKILATEYWNIKAEFVEMNTDFKALNEHEAFVQIGDRTFSNIGIYKTQLDLAAHWKAYTGLPFVFAVWVTNKELNKTIIDNFNTYLANGFNHLDTVIHENKISNFDVDDYLRNKIKYNLDEHKREGLNLYLRKLNLYR
jgi:chorismate dehydratase